MKKFLLIYSFSVLTHITFAQLASQCTRALESAEAAFEQGRLLFILDRSENEQFYECLDGGSFTVDEEIRARKLLVKAYLFTDNEAQAEDKLVDLLVVDKEHQLTPEDPAELHFLYSKFITEPIFRVAIKGGVNYLVPTILEEWNTLQAKGKDYYSSSVGVVVGANVELTIEKHLKKGLEVGSGVQYRVATYGVEGELIETRLGYTLKNTSTMIRMPLLFRYNYNYSALDGEGNRIRVVPYVFLGGAFDLTLTAEYVDANRTGGTAFALQENTSLTDLNQVAKQNISLIGGVGAKLRIGRAQVDFLTFELRYDNALFNYINPDTRYLNKDLSEDIAHVEDDLTLNTVSISVGFTKSFYNPRKRKEYR